MTWGIVDTIVLIGGMSVMSLLVWIVVGLEKRIAEMKRRIEGVQE